MMRLLTSLLPVFPLLAMPEIVAFNGAKPGELPTGWTAAMTHAGGAPRWEIVRDESAPTPPYVLGQVSTDSTAGRFPLAIWGQANVLDGEVKVSFRVVSGQVDQAAGVVWRFRDANNYYIARANALENNESMEHAASNLRGPDVYSFPQWRAAL